MLLLMITFHPCNVLLAMVMQLQENTANSHVTGDRIRVGCKTNSLIFIKNEIFRFFDIKVRSKTTCTKSKN